jgi:hypothetical protein
MSLARFYGIDDFGNGMAPDASEPKSLSPHSELERAKGEWEGTVKGEARRRGGPGAPQNGHSHPCEWRRRERTERRARPSAVLCRSPGGYDAGVGRAVDRQRTPKPNPQRLGVQAPRLPFPSRPLQQKSRSPKPSFSPPFESRSVSASTRLEHLNRLRSLRFKRLAI